MLAVCLLADREAVSLRLTKTIVAPRSPVLNQELTFLVECLSLRHTHAVHLHLLIVLLRKILALRSGCTQYSSAYQRLNRLCPHSAVASRERHAAIVPSLAHRHFELKSERADEILVLVAVVNDGVNHLNLFAASVKVETDYERQPFAPFALMLSANLYHGSQITLPFNLYLLNRTVVYVVFGRYRCGVCRERFLKRADERSLSCHLLALQNHVVQQSVRAIGKLNLQNASVHVYRAAVLLYRELS